MKNKAYFLVFDGFADWESALALSEINKNKRLNVVTVGFTRNPVVSLGGLKILPDIILGEVQAEEAGIFILPGGDMWEKFFNLDLRKLIKDLHNNGTIIAAICGATLKLARAGMLQGKKHTSNSVQFLRENAPGYHEEENYLEQLAVNDQNIITASGLGNIEFAFEILKALSIYDEPQREAWFNLFKHGIQPH